MPVIDLTKTEQYRKVMMPIVEACRDDLAAMGYSVEKDGWELCEFIVFHCLTPEMDCHVVPTVR
jgi:hypothetical protein